MLLAKQSTALTLIVGPILDSTGAEYASAVIGDLSLSKNGATLTALASAATLTYIANGQYTLVLTTGNTDTLGAFQITCNKSTYQMRTVERNVVPATVYDAIITNATNIAGGLVAATGTVSAAAGYVGASGAAVNGTNANTLSSHDPGATLASQTNITAATGITVATNSDKTGYSLTATTGLGNQTSNITGSLSGSVGSVTGNVGGNVTGSVGSVSSYGTLVADIATAVWGATVRTLSAISDSSGITTLLSRIIGTLASGTHNPQSGDSYARLGAPAGASISADIAAEAIKTAAIKAKTDALPADTAASLTALAGYVDTLETELAKVLKVNESHTYVRTGKTDTIVTVTRP